MPEPAKAAEPPVPVAKKAEPKVEVDAAETNAPPVNDDELIKALERIAAKRRSALQDPTPTEKSQAKFFKQADEFRQAEGENIHCLRREHALDSQTFYVVGPAGLKIGRTPPADIVVSEPSVSREHCVIEFAADKLRVLDLNSTNGTYIDNKRIGRAEILPVGSVLRVGNVSFEHEVRSRVGTGAAGQCDRPGARAGAARIPNRQIVLT